MLHARLRVVRSSGIFPGILIVVAIVCNFEAARADAAGLIGGPVDAVQTAGQDARDGRFPGSALAGKDVPVRDAVLGDGVLQGGLDVFLIHHIGE